MEANSAKLPECPRRDGGNAASGFVGSTTYGLLQKLLPLFRAEYPGVELVLREATSVGILQQLEDKALDVGLVRVPLVQASTATLVPLESDEYVAALPRGQSAVKQGILKLSEMTGRAIHHVRAHACRRSSCYGLCSLVSRPASYRRVVQQATQIQTVLALVDESGLGVALVPSVMRRFISDRIVYRPLADLPSDASIGLALAYMADSEGAAASRFRQLSVRVFP